MLSANDSDDSEIFNAEQADLARMEREVFSSDEAPARDNDIYDSFVGPMPDPGSRLAAVMMEARARESLQAEPIQPSSAARLANTLIHYLDEGIINGNKVTSHR